MPICVQDVVPPVNYDKKKARKQYAPRRVGWAPESRPGANLQQELHYPPAKDPAQFNMAMRNIANPGQAGRSRPALRQPDALLLRSMLTSEGPASGGAAYSFSDVHQSRSPRKGADQVDYQYL